MLGEISRGEIQYQKGHCCLMLNLHSTISALLINDKSDKWSPFTYSFASSIS